MQTEDRRDLAVRLFRTIALTRAVELRIEELHREGRLSGSFHSSVGQEGCSAGVGLALRPDDVMTSTHRSHGHAIAKGVSVDRIFAELFGRASGVSGGRGGSMHLHDRASGFLGGSAIVAGAMAWAAGAAWARRRLGLEGIGVSFVGDGAFSQGSFHETLRLALIWESPTLFVCENNRFAHSMPVERTIGKPGAIADFARAEGMRAEYTDGSDAVGVFDIATELVDFVREGRPAFLECDVYRVKPHSLSDPDYLYRPREAGSEWLEERDPLIRIRDYLLVDDVDLVSTLMNEVGVAVDRAVEAAESAEPPVGSLRRQVFDTPELDERD
jgi:TPP-dependent pyruvate/acetoin dehydrogenase alpha subunit